jgi:hypothetical protein
MSKPWHDEIVRNSPPTDLEFIAMMARHDLWPAHMWCQIDRTVLAVQNDKTGALGIICNVSYRDRLTVYEVNLFETDALRRVLASTDPSGVPEHKYTDYEEMYAAGWRPD